MHTELRTLLGTLIVHVLIIRCSKTEPTWHTDEGGKRPSVAVPQHTPRAGCAMPSTEASGSCRSCPRQKTCCSGLAVLGMPCSSTSAETSGAPSLSVHPTCTQPVGRDSTTSILWLGSKKELTFRLKMTSGKPC